MTIPSDAELLPCPFCGSKPILHPEKYDPPAHQPVECPTDECPMSHIWPDINTWNRRAQPSAEPFLARAKVLMTSIVYRTNGASGVVEQAVNKDCLRFLHDLDAAHTLPSAEPQDALTTATAISREAAKPYDHVFAPPAPVPDDLIAEIDDILARDPTWGILRRAGGRIAALAQRIEGAMASRNYAIDLLASALGIEADKVHAVEYYSLLASERIAELEREAERLKAPWLCDCHTWPGPDEAHAYIVALERDAEGLRKALQLGRAIIFRHRFRSWRDNQDKDQFLADSTPLLARTVPQAGGEGK
jgi:hypothetical protein